MWYTVYTYMQCVKKGLTMGDHEEVAQEKTSAGNKVLDAPLEALKDPKCLVGQVIQLGDTSLRCKILDIHVAESGTMYLAYKVL